MFASACRAAETGEWTLRQTASVQHSSKETQITFRKEKFEVFAAHYNRFTAACYMLAQIPNTFVIEYNQINNAKVLDKLLTFLGSRASGEDTMTSFRKQYSGTVREAFVNWDDVQEKLRTMALLEGPAPTISS